MNFRFTNLIIIQALWTFYHTNATNKKVFGSQFVDYLRTSHSNMGSREVLSRVTRIKWLLFLLSISQIWLARPGLWERKQSESQSRPID